MLFNDSIELKILNTEFYDKYSLPKYATESSAGVDLLAPNSYQLFPGDVAHIHTGVSVWIRDPNCMGLIVPRSSTGIKGMCLKNTVGIIDSDYQGEIVVVVANTNAPENIPGAPPGDWADPEKIIDIKRGERFAQLIFVPIFQFHFKIVKEFSGGTGRGKGGFGSTGK